jgi:hypothetical protein
MKTTVIDSGITVNTNTTVSFQTGNVGYDNMLNSQFKGWGTANPGQFLLSPSISFENGEEGFKTINLPPMGKMTTDNSGRNVFYCTYRQASSIARLHEQHLEWNRERKFLLVLQTLLDSKIIAKELNDDNGNKVYLYKVPISLKFHITPEQTDQYKPETYPIEMDGYMEVRIPDVEGGNPSIKIMESNSTVSSETMSRIMNLQNKYAQQFNVTM